MARQIIPEFDQLQATYRLLFAIREGLEDVAAGRWVDDDELGAELDREFRREAVSSLKSTV